MNETRTTVYIYKKDTVEKHMMKKGYKHIKNYFRDLIKEDILRTGDEEDIKKYFKEKTPEELKDLQKEVKEK